MFIIYILSMGVVKFLSSFGRVSNIIITFRLVVIITFGFLVLIVF